MESLHFLIHRWLVGGTSRVPYHLEVQRSFQPSSSPVLILCAMAIGLRMVMALSLLRPACYGQNSTISDVSDPIEHIKLFLTFPEQAASRLINCEFNERINRYHSAIKRQLHRLSVRMNRLFGAGEFRKELLGPDRDRLRSTLGFHSLDEALLYNEWYLKSWPTILEQCMRRNPQRGLKLSSLYRYSHFGRLNLTENPLIDAVSKLLIYSSRMILKSMCCFHDPRSQPYCAFSAFIMRTTWNYITEYPVDIKLPPLHSLYHLELNQALYPLELLDMRRLKEHGLVLWDPRRLTESVISDPELFCFFVKRYIRVKEWSKHENSYDQRFPWYLRIEFALSILNGSVNVYAMDLSSQSHGGYYLDILTQKIVRRTVVYFWKHHRWSTLMKRLWIGLLDNQNDAFDILVDSFNPTLSSLNLFVRITKSLRIRQDIMTPQLGGSIYCLAKSIYFWFVDRDEDMSIGEMHAFWRCSNGSGITIDHLEIQDLYLSPTFSVERYFDTVTNITGQYAGTHW